jgi:hypothetical protein
MWAGKQKTRAGSETNDPEAVQSQVQQPQTHVRQRSKEEEEDIDEVPGKKIKGYVSVIFIEVDKQMIPSKRVTEIHHHIDLVNKLKGDKYVIVVVLTTSVYTLLYIQGVGDDGRRLKMASTTGTVSLLRNK